MAESAFTVSKPRTIDEALQALDAGSIPLCGGTELLAAVRMGLFSPESMVDLKGIPELNSIEATAKEFRIGATVTHSTVAKHSEIAADLPALALACGNLGNPRVRATGSLAGNLCFADPRSDVSTALLALAAAVRLQSGEGQRDLPIEKFVLGEMSTALDPGELVTSILVPRDSVKSVHQRMKFREHPAVVTTVNVLPEQVRVAIGAVGEGPQLFRFVDVDDIDPVKLAQEADVFSSHDGSEEYLRAMLSGCLRDALSDVRGETDE